MFSMGENLNSAYEDSLNKYPLPPDVAQAIALKEGKVDPGFEQFDSDKRKNLSDIVAVDLFADNTGDFADQFENMVKDQLENKSDLESKLDKIKDNIGKSRRDVQRLLSTYNLLKEKYPKEFDAVIAKHSALYSKIDTVIQLLDWIKDEDTISDEELKQKIEEYNEYVLFINNSLNDIWSTESQERRDFNLAAAKGELGFDEKSLTESEKAEFKQFAKDLFKELFPDTYVDTFVKNYTGQKEFDTYQKILLATANGFEYAATGVISLGDPQTYKDIGDAYDMVTGMEYDDWFAMWQTAKMAYDNIDTTELIAPTISLIVSVIVLKGGIAKVQQFASKMGYSQKFVMSLAGIAAGVKFAGNSSSMLNKTIPLGIMTGITLPYFNM